MSTPEPSHGLSTAAEARLLRAAVESGLEAMVVVSPDGRMVSFNHQFVLLWPIPSDVVASGSDDAALRSVLDKVVDPDGFLERVRACYADPTHPARDELLLRDGRVFDRYGTPLRDPGGEYLGWAWYFRDVTAERRAAQEALEAGERFAALARTLQESLLPPHLPDVPGLEVAARYLPAGQGVDVVGDFYDVFQTGESTWAVVIGDVCGKGVEAAKVTALARYTIRAAAIGDQAPTRVLQLLNDAMLRQHPDSERFVTVTFLSLAQRQGVVRGVLCAAGHPPALLRRADGRIERVGTNGMILGSFEDPTLDDTPFDLLPGDTLVLYTDGVLEARAADNPELYGEERLTALVAGLGGRSAAAVAQAVEGDVVAFSGACASDDTAVLVVRVPEDVHAAATWPRG
ncbi:PP2C family protein-serine/threonine phosphatase [Kineococcus xinjiangensis]|uniref:PP2C family protein-serine/threonine phosphatase n=1 Tax=Kineococcus xinjiangensis TaxID=512762 RepID=UPI0011B09F9F|nr:SpoIIE family protein phosphatase [Kineococcus xinjiangensis]